MPEKPDTMGRNIIYQGQNEEIIKNVTQKI
jgi:hypothetical protein